jgi:hypothetical protein
MTIKQLKQIIADLPDDSVILVPAPDHTYRNVGAHITTALYDADHESWAEDWGDVYTPADIYGERFKVLVIR